MALIPSSNRSLLSKANYYNVALLFSDQNIGEQRYGLMGNLGYLIGWKCSPNSDSTSDSCNRSLFSAR